MFKSKKKIAALAFATLSLMTVTAVGFAQKHLISAFARPEVKVELSGAVERDSELSPSRKPMPLSRARSSIGRSRLRTVATPRRSITRPSGAFPKVPSLWPALRKPTARTPSTVSTRQIFSESQRSNRSRRTEPSNASPRLWRCTRISVTSGLIRSSRAEKISFLQSPREVKATTEKFCLDPFPTTSPPIS